MSRPWMPLYVADYLADTRRLSTLEHGAYMLLIMDYWRNGGLPDADEDLANITGMVLKDWLRIKPKIAALFSPGWTHKRIEEELEKAAEKNERRKEAGRRGGLAKAKQNPSNARNLLEQKDSNALASSSQPQSQSSNEDCTLAPAAAYADEIRKTYLKSNQAEPSLYLAGKWRKAGWPIEIVCDVIRAKLEASPGRTFSLQYFENGIAEAVERSKAPVPVATRTGRPFAPSNSMPERIVTKAMSIETQRSAMQIFMRTKNWPFMSPPPGEPGCPVSPEIIAEFQAAKESAA